MRILKHPELYLPRLSRAGFLVSPLAQFVAYFVLSGFLIGQSTLSGIVVDSLSGEPIPFVTVYFDGTTVGTTTGENGGYTLGLGALNLPAVMVATHLNYRPASVMVGGAGNQPTILLAATPNEIAAVEVGDRNNREKNVLEFRHRFLGTDEWARRASLTGQNRLRFDRTYSTDTLRNADVLVERHGLPEELRKVRWASDGKSLTFEQATDLQVHSSGTFGVDVPSLGYRISVNLIGYFIDYRAGRTFSLGTYYFKPYEGPKDRPRRRHVRNRRRVYYSSSQHFLRALFAGDLQAHGFATYEKVDGQFRPIDLRAFLEPVSRDEKALSGLEGRQITILYFHDKQGRPLPPDRRKRAAYTSSYFTVSGTGATFRADGTMGHSPIAFGGAMASSQVTRMLPSDYVPE